MFALAWRTLSAARLTPAIAPVRAVAVEIAWAVLAGVLFVASLELSAAMDAASPDAGWQMTLPHLARQGVRFGTDTCYCYGPLYDLAISPYDPATFERKFVLELLVKAASAILLLRLARQLSIIGGVALLGGFTVGMLILPMNQAYFLLAGLAGLIVPVFRQRFTIGDVTAVPVYLAALALGKFTFFPFAVAGLGITAVLLGNQRSFRLAMVPVGAFASATVLFWMACSQRLPDLPAFLASSLHYTAAYTHGLFLEGPKIEAQLGMTIIAMMALTAVRHGQHDAFRLAGFALIFLVAALGWKAGFVRQDSHAMLPFVLLLFLPMLLQRLTAAPLLLPALAALLAGVGMLEVVGRNQLGGVLNQSLSTAWLSHWQALTHPGDLQARLEQHRREQQAQYDLPNVRAAVGNQAIDAFTECQGVALLNNLNLRPRPTIQSVNVMDAAMLTRNAAYFQSENAPPFVLLTWTSFDNRYPTLTDGPALLQLLLRYEFALEERGYLLLKRRATAFEFRSATILDRNAVIDEIIELPNDSNTPRTLQLTLEPTLFGRARSLAFRPPVVFLLVRTRDGAWHPHRVPPAMAAAEFLVDPLAETAADFAKLFRGELAPNVTAVRVHVQKADRDLVAPAVRFQVRRRSLSP